MVLSDREQDRLVEIGQLIETYLDRSPSTLNTYIPGILKGEPPSYRVKNVESMVVLPQLVELEVAESLKTLRIPGVQDDNSEKAYNLTVSVEVSKDTKQLIFLTPTWTPSAAKVRATISPSTASELVAAWEGLVRAVHVRAAHFNKLRQAAVDHARTTGLLWRHYFTGLAAPSHEKSVAKWVKNGVGRKEHSKRVTTVVPAKREADAMLTKEEDEEHDLLNFMGRGWKSSGSSS